MTDKLRAAAQAALKLLDDDDRDCAFAAGILRAALAEQKPMLEMNQQKREWVGLTDEEITEIRLKMFDAVATNYETYRAIEAKLREKNGG